MREAGVLKSKREKEVRVMSAMPVNTVAEPYIRLRSTHHLEKGYIVIFAGGNGQPYVTTDYPSVPESEGHGSIGLYSGKRIQTPDSCV